MLVRPLTDNCERILEQGSHVVVGVSPFNSYFSEARLRELAAWGKANFSAMHLFIPDVPASYTLEAIGYARKEAAWKAKRQARYLVNKTRRALDAVGITEEIEQIILTWERLARNSRFQAVLQQIIEVYESDSDFRRDYREAARWVLEKHLGRASAMTDASLDLGVKYLLSEMPLFVDTPSILHRGPSVFAYHQCPPLLAGLYRRGYRFRVSDQQGFVVVHSAGESEVEEGMFI